MNAKVQHLLDDLNFESDSENEPDSQDFEFRGSVHRSAAALLMEGKSPEQIGVVLGIDKDKVRALLKQEHTQAFIKELADGLGKEGVENVLKATELDTVFKLLELRDYGSSHSIQLNACKELLTRRRGNQPIRKANEEEDLGDNVADAVNNLDRQIKHFLENKGIKEVTK